MPLVAAYLVPGNPLPYLRPENPPWAGIASACRAAGRSLNAARPDTILVYSTQWMAVLDQLWQMRPSFDDVHVDENWYEYGDLEYRLKCDTELAATCIQGSKDIGISSKGVDYDKFPIDTGTIVANGFLNPNNLPLTIGSNNLYHSFDDTTRLAGMAVEKANQMGRRVALVGVGGMSGSIFRHEIDISTDGIASAEDDEWNRKMLARIQQGGSVSDLGAFAQEYAKEAKADMGFKHFAWVLGGLGRNVSGAQVHAYGATYGSGAAVIEFRT